MHSPATTRSAEHFRAAKIPSLPYGFAPRDRLVRAINEPFVAPVTLVTAPAGYGKTAAVCHWARETSMPVAWVAIAPGETDLTSFMERFADAVVSLLPAIGEACGEDREHRLARLTRLLRAAGETGEHVGIVLDDFELVEDQAVLDALTALLQTLPPTIHLVIVSRTIPSLGVGRLRVLRQVRDIGARQLAFDAEETIACMRAAEYPDMPLETVESRVREAEGWITGLMLMLGTSGGPPGQIQTNGYSIPEHLDAYIEEEVLAFLPSDLREFVLATCFLERLEVELCSHVACTASAGTMLRELARRGVFIEQEPNGTCRYHRLFAESVRRISARDRHGDELRELHRRAAAWHIDRGEAREAIEHHIDAEDWERCTELLKPLLEGMSGQELQHENLQWFNRLPEHVLLADNELPYYFAHTMLTIGPRRKGREIYETWIRPWHDSGNPILQARADACAALIAFYSGDHGAMLRTSQNLLKVIPRSEPAKLIAPTMRIMEVEFTRGNDDAADEALAEATRIRLQLPDDHHDWVPQLVCAPANMLALRGDLEGAKDIYAQEAREFRGTQIDLRSRTNYRLAFIALAQDKLQEAEALLSSYDEVMPQSILRRWQLNTLICQAQALRHKGDLERSESLLLGLIDRSRIEQDKVILAAARAAQASIWVERGELPLVRRWLVTATEGPEPWAHIFGAPNHQLVKGEALIALGRIDDALEHLDLVIAEGTERKRWAELVQAYVYRAVALERSAKRVEAIGAMEEAVDLGTPGGFIQPFLTPFDEVLALLERLTPSRKTNRYLARVLESVRKRGRSSTESLLSDREREILQLAQAGSSNQEIANRLFISQATVKRHLANVNLKLDTRNRVQAIARARELHLI